MPDKPMGPTSGQPSGGGTLPSEGQPQSGARPQTPAYRGPSIVPAGRHSECDGCFSMVLNQFARSFDKSAKRWELIVYPSMFAFIILAMYGFFLIYSLTQDMRTMAVAIDPNMANNMGILSSNVKQLSDNVAFMATHIEYMSDNMETMAIDMQKMSKSFETLTADINTMNTDVHQIAKLMFSMTGQLSNMTPITNNMAAMNKAMQMMSMNMGRMSHDMGGMSRPMSFTNQFMPWGN
jgi:methyl-accepting chemotaxis protein